MRPDIAAADEAEMATLGPHIEALGYVVHIAKLVNDEGNVSPLCAGVDAPVGLTWRETWVYSPNCYGYVNCESCRIAAGLPEEKETTEP